MTVALENCEKPTAKQSIEKLFYLLSWVCLQCFAQDCPIKKKNYFYYYFKLVFIATELRQRSKTDIFQKALFCTLASSINMALKVIQI